MRAIRPIIDTGKSWVKHRATFHRQGAEKNICIFSTARSGTTWLAEMLATQGRFKIVNEPFNLRIPVKRESLGLSSWDDLLKVENHPRMLDYLMSFQDGRDTDLRHKRETPFSKFWHLRTDRIIYKILFACEDAVDWFCQRLNGHPIFLMRHPIAVSVSRTEFPRLQSLLRGEFTKHFDEAQLAFARRILERGTPLEVSALDWCLQNCIPLRHASPDWLVVSYEQLVIEPEIVVDRLVKRLNLHDRQKMLDLLYQASNSTGKSSGESQDVLRDPKKLREQRNWLIEKWKKKVSAEQESRVFEILDCFHIDAYERDRFLPAEKYLMPPSSKDRTQAVQRTSRL